MTDQGIKVISAQTMANHKCTPVKPGDPAQAAPAAPDVPTASAPEPQKPETKPEAGKKAKPVAAKAAENPVLTAFRRAGPELFVGTDGFAYATVTVQGDASGAPVRATFPVESADFADYLKRLSRDETGTVAGDHTVKHLMGTLRLDAADSGLTYPVFLRVAALPGRLLLDLGRGDRKVAQVEPGDWRVTDCPDDVRFVRSSQVGPIVAEPVRGGDLDALFRVVNVEPADRPYVKAWMVANFLAGGGFPILLLTGPDGAGKTTAARFIRGVFDPSPLRVKLAPASKRDLAASVRSAWVQNFDNLSQIPAHLSDAIAGLTTETAFTGRRLFSDFDEAGFTARRPVILNGIPSGLAARPDLASRCYTVRLTPPAAGNRRTEGDLDREYQELAPALLGALLDMLARGMKALAGGDVSRPPVRLADACSWAEACGVCPTAGEFTGLATERDAATKAEILFDWPAAEFMIRLAREAGPDGVEVTNKQLLELLTLAAREVSRPEVMADNDWPKSYRQLGEQLDRHTNALTAQGVKLECLGRKRNGYTRRLSWGGPSQG